MEIHKGARVLYTAVTMPTYPYDNDGNLQMNMFPGWKLIAAPERKCQYSKCLERVPVGEHKGIVIGKTYRAIGIYSPHVSPSWYDPDGDPPYLDETARISLWVVATDDGTDRYYQPVLVHADDLQLDPVYEQMAEVVRGI